MSEFKPGVYKHYKGGFYTALMLVEHHETREQWVVYVSHTNGSTNVREYEAKAGIDAWVDRVIFKGEEMPRFRYIGPVK